MGNSPPGPGADGPPLSRIDRQDPYLRVHAVNIFVSDQERSLRFYVDQLGFEVALDARLQSGQRWLAVAPPDGSTVLSLIAPNPDSPEFKLIGRPTHVVFVTDDVPAKFREWKRRGVRFRHTPRLRRIKYSEVGLTGAGAKILGKESPLWGGVFTRFEDLDHNVFSLVSFDEVSHALEAQRRALAEKMEAERRAVQELAIAREVQAKLFPQTQPCFRTLEYAGVCLQARHVGGDYYDFLNLGQERLGLVVGDISGKGIAAALLMANLQANLRSQCALALDQPQQFLQSVNRLFQENTIDSAYATLFFAEYDDRLRHLRYVNCGHLSGLLLRRDETVERLESTATVLGVFREWNCTVVERRLSPGDMLALYTDGVTEAFNPSGEEFGEPRLIAALTRHRDLAVQALLDSVVADVRRFSPHEQYDDITLIVARCTGTDEPRLDFGEPIPLLE
jgi:serine phosphatase RsbU (regulator of sigma subunit)/catechol 2,3-dioxygenase-like lactoylglutathione lyase family enzyme